MRQSQQETDQTTSVRRATAPRIITINERIRND